MTMIPDPSLSIGFAPSTGRSSAHFPYDMVKQDGRFGVFHDRLNHFRSPCLTDLK